MLYNILHRRILHYIHKDFALYTEDTILYTDRPEGHPWTDSKNAVLYRLEGQNVLQYFIRKDSALCTEDTILYTDRPEGHHFTDSKNAALYRLEGQIVLQYFIRKDSALCTEDTILYTDPKVSSGQIQRTPHYTDLKDRMFYNILYGRILRCTQKILYCTQTRRSALDRFKECRIVQT